MSKLADIEAAVAAYQGWPEVDKPFSAPSAKVTQWLTDLVAVVKAAQAVRAVRHDLIIDPRAALNNPQLETRLGNATRAMNDLMVLVAKLEGD